MSNGKLWHSSLKLVGYASFLSGTALAYGKQINPEDFDAI